MYCPTVDILGFVSWGIDILMTSSLSWRQATDAQNPENPPTVARELVIVMFVLTGHPCARAETRAAVEVHWLFFSF